MGERRTLASRGGGRWRIAAASLAGWLAVAAPLAACGDDQAPAPDAASSAPFSGSPAPPFASPGAGPLPGAPGLGDAYFPNAGNGGYDVADYDLRLTVVPGDRIDGRATITATATAALSSFDLDLRDLTVQSVAVDGAPASFATGDGEVVVTPAAPIQPGATFTTVVDYGGVPEPVTDVEVPGLEIGWSNSDGGSRVLSEPDGASTWFPANDHPSDKATYTVAVTVPAGVDAVGNGTLVGDAPVANADGSATWTYRMDQPMAPYLATVLVGQFDVTTDDSGVVKQRNVFPAGQAADFAPSFSATNAMIQELSGWFGPFPFAEYGAAVLPGELPGYAFEAQTMSLFDNAMTDDVVSHELAHQWFGDDVSIAGWGDIWLAEGFATYGQWIWGAHQMGQTMDQYTAALSPGANLTGTVVDPPAAELFGPNSYDGGGKALEALRRTVGDATFRGILQAWVQRYGGRSASTADFLALVEELGGPAARTVVEQHLHDASTPLPPLATAS